MIGSFFVLNADLTFKWNIDKFNQSNADVSVKDSKNYTGSK